MGIPEVTCPGWSMAWVVMERRDVPFLIQFLKFSHKLAVLWPLTIPSMFTRTSFKDKEVIFLWCVWWWRWTPPVEVWQAPIGLSGDRSVDFSSVLEKAIVFCVTIDLMFNYLFVQA